MTACAPHDVCGYTLTKCAVGLPCPCAEVSESGHPTVDTVVLVIGAILAIAAALLGAWMLSVL